MFWGAIRYDCFKRLLKLPERLCSDSYVEILKNFDKKLNEKTFPIAQT